MRGIEKAQRRRRIFQNKSVQIIHNGQPLLFDDAVYDVSVFIEYFYPRRIEKRVVRDIECGPSVGKADEQLARARQIDIISKSERGMKDPQLTTIFKMAEAFSLTPEEFVAKISSKLPENFYLIER